MVLLVDPSWLNTDIRTKKRIYVNVMMLEFSIYSLSVHPQSFYLATCSGSDIYLWSPDAIFNDNEPAENRLISVLSAESSIISTIRWSHSGKMLASCSSAVSIWMKQSYENPMIDPSIIKYKERWESIVSFSGHSTDIIDISWSPDDHLIASASLDNTVKIWNISSENCKQVTVNRPMVELKGHSGWVMGISWDTLGRYIASQSDKAEIIIWSTTEWNIYKKIQLENISPDSDTARRLSWSPIDSVAVLNRESWKTDVYLMGNKKPILACEFNPVIFHNDERNKNSDKVSIYCALGGCDSAVSIWRINRDKPILVIKKIVKSRITDLCWAQNGYNLYISSSSGEVVVLSFTTKELGTPFTPREKELYINKHFGSIRNCFNDGIMSGKSNGITNSGNSINLPESLDILNLMQEEEKTASKEEEEEEQTQKPTVVHNTEKQIETVTKSGKKRIQPIFVSYIKPVKTSELFTNEASDVLPANPARVITEIERLKALEKKKEVQESEKKEEDKEEELKIKREKMEEEEEEKNDENNNESGNSSSSSSSENSSSSDSDNEILDLHGFRQHSQSSPSRKRKHPQQSPKSPSLTSIKKPRQTRLRPIPNNEDELSQNQNDNISDSTSTSNSNTNKTHNDNDDDKSTNNNTPATTTTESEARKPKRRRKPRPSHNSSDELVETHEVEPQRPSYLLIPIQPSALLTCTIFNDNIINPTNILYTITAQSDLNNNTKTRIFKNNIEELSFIPNQAVCMVGNKNYLCICDNCNTLYILNSNNGIHLGSYILPAPLHLFALNSNSILFCLTINGNCLLYDLSDFHLICESDIISVIQSMCDSIPLPNEITILRIFITNNGIPVITIKIVNNIRCFAFNVRMKLWTPMDSCGYLLSEFYSTYSYSLPLSKSSSNPSSSITTVIASTASSTSSNPNDNSNNNNNDNSNNNNYNVSNSLSSQQSTSAPLNEIQLPLREFQKNNNNNNGNNNNNSSSSNLVRLLYNSSNSDIQQSTRIHIENQIGSSIVLNSKEDFKYWMIKYIDFLAKNSDEARITVLCNSFLGKSNSIYCYKSFDLNTKEFLFNEVLPILSTNISLQRLVSQFMDEYNSLQSQNKVNVDANGTYKPNYY